MRKTANESIFWSKVEKTPSCWNWIGATHKGYGRYTDQAHRISYELAFGPIPEGLQIDHLCRNTLCVNPVHLEAVTRQENMRRRSEAQTHCKAGHPFDDKNTYYRTTSGRRSCRACNCAAVARYKARRIGALS